MRGWQVGLVLGVGMLLAGCSRESRSPDAIRHDTARATGAVKRDGVAVAKGMWDGLRSKGPVNINKASTEELKTLPGVSDDVAERIVAGRPYESGGELWRRHILSKAQYDRLADKVAAR